MAERVIKSLIRAVLPFYESPVKTTLFSPEAREALKREDYCIYPLTGKPIDDLDLPLSWIRWRPDYDYFKAFKSRLGEVAINPDQFLLPNSNNMTLEKQEELVRIFSENLSGDIEGVRATIGNAADYLELFFAHLRSTDQRLFAQNDNYGFARTITPYELPASTIIIGKLSSDLNLSVSYSGIRDRRNDLRVAPLVVPTQEE